MTDTRPIDILRRMTCEEAQRLRFVTLAFDEQMALVFTHEQLDSIMSEYMAEGPVYVDVQFVPTPTRIYGVPVQVLSLEEPIPNDARLYELDQRGLVIDLRWFEV